MIFADFSSRMPGKIFRKNSGTIKTDIQYVQAKDILSAMSTPGNDWYPDLEGTGKAKETLLQYMNSVVP